MFYSLRIVQIFKKHTKDLKIWGENIIGAGKLWYQTLGEYGPRRARARFFFGVRSSAT